MRRTCDLLLEQPKDGGEPRRCHNSATRIIWGHSYCTHHFYQIRDNMICGAGSNPSPTPQEAYEEAVLRNYLSFDPDDKNYFGHYSYLFTKGHHHFFKNKRTEEYKKIPLLSPIPLDPKPAKEENEACLMLEMSIDKPKQRGGNNG